jgi:hypothetical protein
MTETTNQTPAKRRSIAAAVAITAGTLAASIAIPYLTHSWLTQQQLGWVIAGLIAIDWGAINGALKIAGGDSAPPADPVARVLDMLSMESITAAEAERLLSAIRGPEADTEVTEL